MKHTIILVIGWILFMNICFACKRDSDSVSIIVKEWNGKKIKIPELKYFTVYATDTISYPYKNKAYKTFIYVDSIGCLSCKLQLDKWKELIPQFDSITKKNMAFLFILDTKNVNRMEEIFREKDFKYPVYIDMKGELNRLNHFSSDDRFQTFLLDADNRVVIIGNPVHNSAIKDLYLKQVTGKEYPVAKKIQTTAEAVNSEINFGSLHKKEAKTEIVKIRNTGKAPLIIVDVNTSCGCTTARYDKTPAQPGDMLKIEIKMTPEESGFFNKTVTVRCNTNKPIIMTIKGNVQQ